MRKICNRECNFRLTNSAGAYSESTYFLNRYSTAHKHSPLHQNDRVGCMYFEFPYIFDLLAAIRADLAGHAAKRTELSLTTKFDAPVGVQETPLDRQDTVETRQGKASASSDTSEDTHIDATVCPKSLPCTQKSWNELEITTLSHNLQQPTTQESTPQLWAGFNKWYVHVPSFPTICKLICSQLQTHCERQNISLY